MKPSVPAILAQFPRRALARGRALFSPVALTATLAAQSVPPPADEYPEGSIVALDSFVVTDARSTQTTLPVRPVTSIYGIETPFQDIPRSITQVNAKQLLEDAITNFNDFQRYAPSVNANTGSSLHHFGSPSIRGAVSDLYQNGVRAMVRVGNTRPFQINAYEAVDIVAGPAPVIFGPSARTAGYVNFITKKPYFDRQHTTINVTLGKFLLDESEGSSYQDLTFQIDNGGPLVENKLAYRLSYQEQNADSYYRAGFNKYRTLYGALAWLPATDVAVDWNAEYGDYRYQPTGVWNRVTQELIDDSVYLAGPATPIIRGSFSPTGYYSPVWNPALGRFDGQSFIARTAVPATNRYVPGALLPGAPTAAQAGIVSAWVLDPALLTPTRIKASDTLYNPDTSVSNILTRVFNTQLRVKKTVSDEFALFSNAYYQYYWTDSYQNGGFYNAITSHIFEERVEAVLKKTFRLFGHDVLHQSNTGISYRFDKVKNVKDSDPAAVGAATDAYDITADPGSVARNALFGTRVYPLYYNENPVLSPYFGYLRFNSSSVPSPFNPDFSVTPGGSGNGLGSASNHTWQHALSLFSQHSFRLGSRWIWDVGARGTINWSKIANPLIDPTNPFSLAADVVDHTNELIPSATTSLSYKPATWLTTYATYAYVEAQNGMTTGTPTWAAGNKLDETAFHSVSELWEAGAKAEIVPHKLFGTLSVYRQTRELGVVSYDGEARTALGLYRGLEVSLRYQPTRQFTLGANYNYLGANFVRNSAGSTATVADGARALLGNVPGYVVPPGDYRITNLPRNYLSAYANYTFAHGWGVRADASWQDSYIITGDGTVVIPDAFNLNAAVFYQQPRWTASVDVTNVTNERNFNGAVVAEPIGVKTRFSFRF